MTTHFLAIAGGGSIGKCGRVPECQKLNKNGRLGRSLTAVVLLSVRLSQPSWLAF